jgi:hypothetical protein
VRGEELTLEQVGKRFGLTRERIRQIEEKALRKLGHQGRGPAIRELFELCEERPTTQGGLADVAPAGVNVHCRERGSVCRDLRDEATFRRPEKPHVAPKAKRVCTAPLPPSLAAHAKEFRR